MPKLHRRSFIRHSLKVAAAATAQAALPSWALQASPLRLPFLTGVNLAGAEFGTVFPGEHGTNFMYPGPKDVDYYRSFGFNVLRLPFRWDRLQPDLFAEFETAEWQRFERLIKLTLDAGFYIILDPHNGAHRRIRDDGFSKEHMIGSREVPVEAFTQFWRALTQRTKQHDKVIYGLMNEPVYIAPQAWFDAAQKAIDVIRYEGADQLLLVPGTGYSTAHTWLEDGNGIMAGIKDPGDNFAIEAHQYFDWNSSGQHAEAVSATIGTERIAKFEAWARENKLRAFLGEFGVSSDPVNLEASHRFLQHLSDHRDVWLGWAAWAGGPWWPPDFPYKLEPVGNSGIPPQTRLLEREAANAKAVK